MSQTSFGQNTQSILSLGYIYLIFMGILNETLFFQQVDIHFLKYSSILDVIISPIDKLSTGKGLVISALLLIVVFVLPKLFSKKSDKAWFKKSFKLSSDLTPAEVESSLYKIFIFYAAVLIFGVFIGSGAFGGFDLKEDIKNNNIAYNDSLTFITGDSEQVEIVGKNSSFLFYLSKESKTVIVSPIDGVIKSIKEIGE